MWTQKEESPLLLWNRYRLNKNKKIRYVNKILNNNLKQKRFVEK